MTQANLDQYVALKAKAELSVEEQAVITALEAYNVAAEAVLAVDTSAVDAALVEATTTLEAAQAALVATPSTTV